MISMLQERVSTISSLPFKEGAQFVAQTFEDVAKRSYLNKVTIISRVINASMLNVVEELERQERRPYTGSYDTPKGGVKFIVEMLPRFPDFLVAILVFESYSTGNKDKIIEMWCQPNFSKRVLTSPGDILEVCVGGKKELYYATEETNTNTLMIPVVRDKQATENAFLVPRYSIRVVKDRRGGEE